MHTKTDAKPSTCCLLPMMPEARQHLDELVSRLYHFSCSKSCSQASKKTFIQIFLIFLLNYLEEIGIILLPNYTCMPSINSGHFVVS